MAKLPFSISETARFGRLSDLRKIRTVTRKPGIWERITDVIFAIWWGRA